MVKSNYKVNIFVLGTLCITTSRKGKGNTPQTATIPGFRVTFTSSKITKALGIKKIVISDSSPIIGTMTDLFTNEKGTSFTARTSTRRTYSLTYSNTVAIADE